MPLGAFCADVDLRRPGHLVQVRPAGVSRAANEGEGSFVSETTTRPLSGLSAMKLDELKGVASSMGITGTTKMRKSDLVEAIKARQSGGSSAPAGATAPTAPTAPTGAPESAGSGDTPAAPQATPSPRVAPGQPAGGLRRGG